MLVRLVFMLCSLIFAALLPNMQVRYFPTEKGEQRVRKISPTGVDVRTLGRMFQGHREEEHIEHPPPEEELFKGCSLDKI